MPNHITNIVQILGTEEQVKAVRDYVGSENTIFDFKKIIPLSDDLEIVSDGLASMLSVDLLDYPCSVLVARLKKADDNQIENFCQAVRNLQKHGFPTWYEANRVAWGTKWNAYDLKEIAPDTVKFDTAWCHPEPVMLALSAKFPDVAFCVKYADEDIGNNLGHLEYRNGEIAEHFDIEDAERFAMDVKGWSQEAQDEFFAEDADLV